MGNEIKNFIKEHFKLTCSIGIGPNKFFAKIAAGENKPDGLTIVHDEDVQAFLDPLSVRELMGIGPKTGQELMSLGVKTVKELRSKSKEWLIENFGKQGLLI